ncbi:MAG: creatininase family protein [Chloroflexi bacterium]|nr:creatininase family protein [Chloroflexota bacterium]
MRLDELNWMDVESYLKSEDRIMLVLGACEQHGYLSLLTDIKIPLALADAASQETGVLVAPPLNFGVSAYFLDYPGTISLRVSTFLDVVEDIVRSLYRQGFRKFMLLNGHGGNEPARGRLVEIGNDLKDAKFYWYSWWTSHSVEAVAMKHGLKSYHASWIENFSFTQVANVPEGEKTPPGYRGVLNAEATRQVFGDGVFGGPYQVDPAIMNEIFSTALADVLYFLEDIAS